MKRIYPFFSIFLCAIFGITNSQAQCPTLNDFVFETVSDNARFTYFLGISTLCSSEVNDDNNFPSTITIGGFTLVRIAVINAVTDECSVAYSDGTPFDPGTLTVSELENLVNNNIVTIDPFVLLDDTNCGPLTISLPVELSRFEAKAQKESIALIWRTETETDNAGFEVQRSEDGKNFKTLEFIEGAGTTVEPQFYTFSDETAQEGVEYFYRLKQIDFDGAFDYSKVLVGSLKVDHLQVSNVFPNPAIDAAQINVTVPQEEQVTLELFDNTGKLLHTQQQQVGTGVQTLELDLDGLIAGLYVVKLQTNQNSVYRKVVIR